jgi:hypothetical protein
VWEMTFWRSENCCDLRVLFPHLGVVIDFVDATAGEVRTGRRRCRLRRTVQRVAFPRNECVVGMSLQFRFHVTIKMLKRQMHSRADLTCSEKRILLRH